MNKKYNLIVIISALLMVFEFLLAKKLLFLTGMDFYRITIPLVFIGYSAGSAASKIKFFRTHFHVKILMAITCAIIASSFLLTHMLVFKNFSGLTYHLLVLIWPFIFFGIYFGKVYSETENLKKVFLANGFGLMLGAIFSGKVFRFMGWEGGLLFICSLLLLIALFFEKEFKKLSLSVLIIAILFFHFNLLKEANIPNFNFTFFSEGGKIVKTENTELVRTDLIKIKNGYRIFTDGDSPTPVFYNIAGFFDTETDKNDFIALPYIFRNYNKALIIGTGGGTDLANALRAGVPDIIGIELNPVTVRLMKKDFKEYSGGIYLHPAIEIITQEGRSYLQNTNDSYDLIVLNGVDTGTTSSFASSTSLEAYLYTKQAVRRYWEILSDKGVLFIARTFPAYHQNRGLLQLLKIYRAIEDSNLSKHIKEHICIISSESREPDLIPYGILLSKTKFTRDEYIKLNSTPHKVLYFPEVKEENENLWSTTSKLFDVRAISDNRPSLDNIHYWWKTIPKLLIIIPFIFFALMASLFRKEIGIRKGALFLLLGIGYIAVEISITERMLLFLRNPAYSMQIVLSSFLVFGGLGGYFAASLKKGKVSLYSLILFLAIILYMGIFDLLYRYQLPGSQIGRIILSFLIIAPIGFLTAIPFAIALSRGRQRHILYAIDATGTVVGTLLIFFIHIHFGFNAGFTWAAFIYLMIPFFLKRA